MEDENIPDSDLDIDKVNITIDSGADAPVFPSFMIHCGRDHSGQAVALQDAQGRQIPVLGQKAISVLLQDANGTEIELKDDVIFSHEISQPMLSYGRLMNAGWSICAQKRCLKNGNYEIPLEFQNNSLVVKGHVRSVVTWSPRVCRQCFWLEQGTQSTDLPSTRIHSSCPTLTTEWTGFEPRSSRRTRRGSRWSLVKGFQGCWTPSPT